MTGQAIHFGTSGWRGIIADDFTFSDVRRASRAIAARLRADRKSPAVIVGYDTRFLSEEFARSAAGTLSAQGCRVFLCATPTPTPAIAHAILHGKLDGGVNITASHNPGQYNGLRLSGPDGGPALSGITEDIEERAARMKEDGNAPDEIADDFARTDPREPYFEQLARMVRFDAVGKAKGGFVCDALHGCGAGWLDRILREHDAHVSAIRGERDVLFEGSGPDPSEENLAPLQKAVAENKALAGLATDGDADRFGVVDRDGSFVPPDHILALVFDYLLETRGQKLGASRSVATTHLLDAAAKLHGAKIYETPVGFQHVGPLLRNDTIALGGDEAAGMTVRGHLPEKDGILACLLVAEMIAARQSSLADQRADLFRRVGREFWPLRLDLHFSEEARARLSARLKSDLQRFAGRRVAKQNRLDGLKLIFEDDDWVLLRPSGTEPLVHIYAESSSINASKTLADQARAWITE